MYEQRLEHHAVGLRLWGYGCGNFAVASFVSIIAVVDRQAIP